MRLSEIAEFVVDKYPDCCMASNNVISKGCREDWYEEYLIDELMSFFSYEIMDMCGCGCPEDTHEMIRRVLNVRYDWHTDKIEYEEIKKRYKEDLHLDTEDTLHYGALQFVLYMLDSNGILEHGGSIGGCWLTDLGKMYLTVLNAWHEQEEKREEDNAD